MSEVRTHTALHVLKGAVYKTLGAKWTTGVSVNGTHGRLTVESHQKPSDDEIEKIEALTNQKIQENSLIEIYMLPRSEAENKWGDFIYDKFPIPEHIQMLQIFHLPDWNVNACNKEHCKSTGEIGKLKISKTRYRATKKLFEISFDLME